MRSSALTVFPLLALAALVSASPLPIQFDSYVSAPMSDIDTAAAPVLTKRDFKKFLDDAGKDIVHAADSVYGTNYKRETKSWGI